MAEEEVKEDSANADADVAVLAADQDGEANLDSISDVPVEISAVLGKTSIAVNDLLALGKGSVISLDRKVGESIDIFVNDRLVAKGEVVIVESRIGITMTEIIKKE